MICPPRLPCRVAPGLVQGGMVPSESGVLSGVFVPCTQEHIGEPSWLRVLFLSFAVHQPQVALKASGTHQLVCLKQVGHVHWNHSQHPQLAGIQPKTKVYQHCQEPTDVARGRVACISKMAGPSTLTGDLQSRQSQAVRPAV